MNLTLLEAVNYALPYMGEAVVTSTDARNPTVALVLAAIKDHQQRLLAEGWWFNEFETTLYPDAEKTIATPTNLLSIYSTGGRTLESRNGKLYDLDKGSFLFDKAVKVNIKECLAFEDLPYYAAALIRERAAIQVYVQDYGPEGTIKVLTQNERELQNMLRQEHLRKKRYSTIRSSRAMRFMRGLRT